MRRGADTKDGAARFPGIVDIHCHILPGVDDGASSLRASLELLKKEYEDGVRHVILTPHYRLDMFENEEEDILESFEALQEAAGEVLPRLRLYLGCEFHAHMDMVGMLRTRRQLRLADSDFVLTEFSTMDSKEYIRDRLYELRASGYEPIVAHAERYQSVVKDVDFVEELVNLGAYIQVNADSILGVDGRSVKKFCQTLMKNDLIHFVGSDAHNMKTRPPRMGECAAYLKKKMGPSYARELLFDNPMEIINFRRE